MGGREDPLKAFRWHADECPTLNAGLAAAIFQGIRTCIARKPYIFVIFQCGGPDLDPHINFTIFWYIQRATKTQTSLRKCAFSIQH